VKTKGAAAYLGCSRSHIEKLVHSGKLKPVTAFGLGPEGGKWWFDVEDLDKFVEEGKDARVPDGPTAA
jgi:excisionase family DNA binding protein